MENRPWARHRIDDLKAPFDGAISIGPFGSRMKADLYVEEGVPVIRGNNLSDTKEITGEFVFIDDSTADSLKSSNVFAGDLVFPHRGSIGLVGIVPSGKFERYVLSTSLMKMTCDTAKVDPLFLFYFFRSHIGRHELLKNASTVGTPGIATPLTSLKSIELALPPLTEQRAIVHVLGALDDKIQISRRMNAVLERMAQTLFRSWFVDFDPVNAKAEDHAPEGMDTETATLFPDAVEESEIGAIPAGWRVATIAEAFEVNPARKLGKGKVAPYLDMGNMPTDSARALDVYDREFGSGSKFENGDTLVARITPCLENGKTAFVDFLGENEVGWGSTEYIVLRPKPPLPDVYAYYLARTEEFRSFAISNMTGSSGRQRVPADCLNNYKIAVPPKGIAARFGNLACQSLATMKANDDQARLLKDMRDTLLPKLISGDVRLPEDMVAAFSQ
jgi:type I restriction enzyme S subunit